MAGSGSGSEQQQSPAAAAAAEEVVVAAEVTAVGDDERMQRHGDETGAAAEEDLGGEEIPSCIREVDGRELKPNDEVFFEREDGLLEEGVVVKLERLPAAAAASGEGGAAEGRAKVMGYVRYKDAHWGKYSAYNASQDVETLLFADQLVTRTRTRRAPRPVARYQPPEELAKPKPRAKAERQPRSYNRIPALAAEEERRRQRRLRRKQQQQRRAKRQKKAAAREKRRGMRARRRELARRYLAAVEDGRAPDAALPEGEMAELLKLLGVAEPAMVLDAVMALPNLDQEDGEDDMDCSGGSEGALSSDGSISDGGSSSSSSSEEASADDESSVFPEEDSASEAAPMSESDVFESDLSTDSCPSEPEFSYWRRVRDPSRQALRGTGVRNFGLCPKDDSSDSEDADEEPLEMGLTATVLQWSTAERLELLREYLQRPASRARRQRTGAMSYREWCLTLQLISEDCGGLNHLEGCSAIKGVKRCEGMRTMYGAIRAPLIQEMIRFANVTKEDRFVDIGSGLGTVVLQMAAVTGCQATGIELEQSRYTLSAMLHEELIKLLGQQLDVEPEFVQQLQGRIEMINGDIRAHEQKILDSTAIYFNNHGVWFDETASKQGEISVEHWVAKLFAKTAIGTRLVILKSMPHLKGNWFKEERYMARHDWLTWARDDKPLFCYTKLKDTWTCEKCAHENPIVPEGEEDSVIWEMQCVNNCASRAHRLRARGPGRDQ